MKNLRKLRRDAALTQYALAKATGIDRTKISHAELGMVTLNADECARIRKVLLDVTRRKSARVLRELDPGAEKQ
jgi:transcriptional regulator with XRE-family HTH domain